MPAVAAANMQMEAMAYTLYQLKLISIPSLLSCALYMQKEWQCALRCNTSSSWQPSLAQCNCVGSDSSTAHQLV